LIANGELGFKAHLYIALRLADIQISILTITSSIVKNSKAGRITC